MAAQPTPVGARRLVESFGGLLMRVEIRREGPRGDLVFQSVPERLDGSISKGIFPGPQDSTTIPLTGAWGPGEAGPGEDPLHLTVTVLDLAAVQVAILAKGLMDPIEPEAGEEADGRASYELTGHFDQVWSEEEQPAPTFLVDLLYKDSPSGPRVAGVEFGMWGLQTVPDAQGVVAQEEINAEEMGHKLMLLARLLHPATWV